MALEAISWSTQRPSSLQITLEKRWIGMEWSLKYYSILLWRVFLDDHIDELISVLVNQLDALFVDRGGQAVAKDVKSLLDLRLVGLVLQKRKNS